MKTMFKHSPLTFFLLSALLMLGTGLHAQQNEENGVELEIFYLVSLNQPPKLYYQTTDGSYKKLKMNKRGRGQGNIVPRGENVTFYQEVLEDGQKIMQPAANFPLPAGTSRVLLFIYLDKNSKVQYRVYPDSPGIHKGGQLRLINLTNQDVASVINNQMQKLSPGGDQQVDVLSEEKKFHFAFGVIEPEPYKSPVKTLPLRTEQHRLLIVFSYLKKPILDKEGNITSYTLVPETSRFYDRLKEQ